MAIVVEDTFTDSDGTLLEAHTPEVGGSWAKAATSDPSAAVQIINGRLSSTVDVLARYKPAQQPGDATFSFDAYFDVVTIGAGRDIDFLIHWDEPGDNFYALKYNGSVPRIELRRIRAGVDSGVLKTWTLNSTTGVTKKVTFTITVNAGSNVRFNVKENDVTVGTDYVDSSLDRIEANGDFGLQWDGDNSGDDTRGSHLSRLTVTSATIAGGGGGGNTIIETLTDNLGPCSDIISAAFDLHRITSVVDAHFADLPVRNQVLSRTLSDSTTVSDVLSAKKLTTTSHILIDTLGGVSDNVLRKLRLMRRFSEGWTFSDALNTAINNALLIKNNLYWNFWRYVRLRRWLPYKPKKGPLT